MGVRGRLFGFSGLGVDCACAVLTLGLVMKLSELLKHRVSGAIERSKAEAVAGVTDSRFPDTVLAHTINFDADDPNGDLSTVWVDPSETFGHAIARLGVKAEEIVSVAVDGPLWYEPEWTAATR